MTSATIDNTAVVGRRLRQPSAMSEINDKIGAGTGRDRLVRVSELVAQRPIRGMLQYFMRLSEEVAP